MSNFNPEDFESPQNITVPIESRTIELNVATVPVTQLRLNTQSLAGKIAAKIKIVNDDPVNSITYRIPSPSAPLRTVPPSSSTTIEEYTYFIELNFNIANITSILELDLIKRSDGQKRKSLVGKGAA